MGDEEEKQRTDFWMKIAALVFGLWSASIWVGVAIVRDALLEVVQAQKQMDSATRSLERTVALIEERQRDIRARLIEVENDHRVIIKNNGKP